MPNRRGTRRVREKPSASAGASVAGRVNPNALDAAGLSAAYLELAHDLGGIGSYVLNLRTRILYVSREMALLLGAGDVSMAMPLEEYQRRFRAPDDSALKGAAAETAYDAEDPLGPGARIVRADGRSLLVRNVSVLRTNVAGEPVRVGMLREVTEQGAAHDVLARSEQQQLGQQVESLARMALVMEHANDAILILAEDGHILDANERSVTAYGYTLEELRGLTIADLRPDSTQGAIQAQLKAAGTSAGAVFEALHRRKDGSVFAVEVSSRLVESDGNRFRLSIVRDISQRKEQEAQIARFNRLYAAVGQISHQAASVSSRDGLLSAVCRLLVETSGFKMSWAGWTNPQTSQVEAVAEYGDTSGYLASICVYADDRPEGRGPTGTAVREARTVVCNDFAINARMAPWRERASVSGFRASIALPIFQGGAVVGALTVYASEPNVFGEKEVALCNEAAEAVTLALDKLESERRRAQAEARQTLIVESSEDAIISKTLDGVVTSWNRGAEKLFGYTADEAVGKSVLAIFPSSRVEEETDILRRISLGETVQYFETIRKRKSGESVEVSVAIAPLRDDSGKIVGASKIARDITDRKRTDAINAARLHVIQYAVSHSLDELLEETLNEAERLTGSQISFYHFVEDDQLTLSLQNWSTRTKAEFCHAKGKGEHYSVSQAGVWVECVLRRRPVIHNDYASLPNRKGIPEGHATVVRELVVPVMRGDKIRAILGVGNKPTDYVEKDVEALSLLADLAWEIADRKRADELLRASEARFRTLIENAPLAIGVSRDGRTIYVNSKYRELFRIPDSVDVIGRSFLELWAPETREMLELNSRRRARGEPAPAQYEGTAIRFDGDKFPVHVAVTTVQLAEGAAAVGFLVDLTENRRAEVAVRQAEEKYRTIYENALEGMYRTTPAGQFIDANPALARLLGYSSPEEVMSTVRDSAHQTWKNPADREIYRERLEAHGVLRGFETQFLRRDGVSIWVSLDSRRVAGPDGRTLYYEGFIEDITERSRAETELREAEELYRGIFEGAAEGIFRTSPTGKTLAANPTMATMLGYDSPAQLLAEVTDTSSALWPKPADRMKFVQQLETHGQVRSYECQLRRRDGKLIWTLTNARRVLGGDGQALYYEGFISDISEKKQLEEQFLRVQRLESIGMLAAGIAHDLNNVLAPIRMAAPLLAETRTDPGDLQMLKVLEASAERGAGLVRQILGFARGVSGAPQLVQVKHLLRDVADMVSQTFPKSIVLSESIPKELWPVLANPTQLHQVLLNLCVNARDAMPQGGSLRLAASNQTVSREMAARLGELHTGDWLVLEVEDTGTGMSPEVLGRMWEPFFTTKGTEKGTGLGLPTVRGIVEAHGGFLTVSTEVGRGSKFSVYLPPAESQTSATANTAAVSTGKGAGETILFVDDEPAIREMARPTLMNAGYMVVIAENGARAMELFQLQPDRFAVVVTDLDMPVVDGPTFARAVRQLRPATKVLGVSGTESRTADLSWREFADDFIQKPFSPAQLVTAVQGLLGASPPCMGTGSSR
jgi:PAS domain S-box-containing protein